MTLLIAVGITLSRSSLGKNTYRTSVVDVSNFLYGDTITVLNQNNESVKIRLAGVDCPESSQSYGDKAKQFVVSKVSGKRVRIMPDTIDRYGRTVGIVLINGENLNEQIVAHGHGWVYRKYCTADYCNDWLRQEETARDAHTGLWKDKNPQPPWEWRTEHRGKNGNNGNVSVANTSAAVVPGAGGSIIYHGNRRSHVFHGPSCRDYNCKNCTVRLESYQEAVGAGYRAHRECVNE